MISLQLVKITCSLPRNSYNNLFDVQSIANIKNKMNSNDIIRPCFVNCNFTFLMSGK